MKIYKTYINELIAYCRQMTNNTLDLDKVKSAKNDLEGMTSFTIHMQTYKQRHTKVCLQIMFSFITRVYTLNYLMSDIMREY